MPGRPVFLQKFGSFLVDMREARGWKQSQAADIATRRGIGLSYQALRWLEEGKTKSPDPDTLRAVGRLYDLPYEMLAAMVISERYGIAVSESDLTRHTGEKRSALHHEGGGADVPASARILELERRVQEYEAALREVQDVAGRLVEIAVRGAEGGTAGGRQATRRRRRRRTG